MTIALSANTPRVSYTVNEGVTRSDPYPTVFVFFETSDVNVFVDGVARTYDASTASSTKFTLSGGNGSTGSVTTPVTGASGGSTVVITRDVELKRTTDFPSSGAFEISKLNTELDTILTMISDSQDENSRAVRLLDNDSSATLTLPLKANRVGKILGFNSSTGNAEAVNHITTAAVTVSTVGVGGSATASVSQSGNTVTFALGIPTGATGATGATGPSTSFTITDGSTSQTLENSNTLTVTSGEGIDATVSATDTLTIAGEDASTSNKGVASFHSDNFSVSSGAVTIKDQGVAYAEIQNVSATDKILGRSSSGAGVVEEISCTSAGRALLDDANASAQRTTLGLANFVATNVQNTFTKAQLPSTYTAALSATSGVLDYDTYQNFIITLASGSNTLAAPTTEASQIGQTGVIIFIQPSSSSAGTISLHGDYETVGAGGASSLTLSSTNNQYDVVPYLIKADNSILLGTPQLNFG